MALRKLEAVTAPQTTVGMMVRIVEPNGAGLPEAMAKGGGEMYAKGAYGKVIQVPTGGLGIKIHPTTLHDLQTHGYFKLTGATVVQPIEFDAPHDLLQLAAEQLNAFTQDSQPLMNIHEGGRFSFLPLEQRTQMMEAAVNSVTFEHDRLADMIEAATGFELDKETPAPIRNYGEGRLERQAEFMRQQEAALLSNDNYGDNEDDDDEQDRGDHNQNARFEGFNGVVMATGGSGDLPAGTTDADGVVTLLGDGAVGLDNGATTGTVVAVVAIAPAAQAEQEATIVPAAFPSIPRESVDLAGNSTWSTPLPISDAAPAAEQALTLEDLGIGTDIPTEDEGDAPRA